MPIVNILVTREGTGPGAERTTREQKAAVYKGIADLLFTIMGKPHEDTTVIFHEHEIDDIGQGTAAVRLPQSTRSGSSRGPLTSIGRLDKRLRLELSGKAPHRTIPADPVARLLGHVSRSQM
ncbi:tautomerase family protein [Paraburkholderia phytofirmans]|uniref:tautomerase family protein n=1 Tax=Paraburkholderia phytofirmans TaxID=261302 RepID=UPI0038BC0652